MHKRLDGGYGWAVVFGQFIIVMLVWGTSKTMGVWFVYFREEYNATYAATATIAFIHSVTESSSALIFSFLAERYGSRPIMFAGGIIFVGGAVGSVFASSIFHLTITFGAMGGVGGAMLFYPGSQILPKYFDQKIALASAFVFCGGSVASLFFPYMVEYSVMKYGINGSFLILAAVYMHIFIAVALMRPASFFYKQQHDDALPVDDISETCEVQKKRKKSRSTFSSSLQRYKSCLSQKSFLFYYYAHTTLMIGCVNFLSFQQAHVKDVGISDPTLLASLTSIAGVCELVSRVTAGICLHYNVILPYRLQQLTAMACTTLFLFYPLFDQYWMAAVTSGVLAVIWSSMLVAVFPVLRIIIGIDLASAAFGLLCFAVMIAFFSVQLSGFIRDYTGSFFFVYYACAALQVTGTVALEIVAWRANNSIFHKISSLIRKHENIESDKESDKI